MSQGAYDGVPIPPACPVQAQPEETSQTPAGVLPWSLVVAGGLALVVTVFGVWLLGDGHQVMMKILQQRPDLWLLGGAGISFLVLCCAGLALGRQSRQLHQARGAAAATARKAEQLEARCSDLDRALGESEGRFRTLMAGMKGYAWFILDPGGYVLSWNEAAQQIYGYRAKEIVGRHFSCLVPNEDGTGGKAVEELKEATARGRFEDRCWRLRKDGQKFWAHLVLAAVNNTDRPLQSLLVMTRDITEQKQAEEALRRSHFDYHQLTETARDLVLTVSLDGRLVSLNPAFEKITGWSRSQWVGKAFTALLHAEDLSQATRLHQRLIQGHTSPVCELRLQRASQKLATVEFTATPQVQQGKVTGWLGLARDISDQKRTEETLRHTEEQLRQAQKMEAVGRLAGGVAHDFNNLLTIIGGYSDILLNTVGPEEAAHGLLLEIRKAGERAASLTRQLLAFSRKQVLQPRVVNLNDLIAETSKMLQRLIGEDVELITSPAPAFPLVNVDPGQIEQVLMNLAVNARDAMPQGGKLTITTNLVDLEESQAHLHPVVPPGHYVLLAVSDTGCGMDPTTQLHLFEPFFTTKPQGRGTGLGLATVYGIVTQSGGHIEVVSELGRGTTFRLYLPRPEALTPPTEKAEAPLPAATGTETILLVEDEDGVRALSSRTLQAHGYTVLAARDGVDALTVAEQCSKPIHLVVTDVVMPRMSGVALVQRLLPQYPQLKVLYMSGYTDSALIRHGATDPTVTYLRKPFPLQELAHCVRRLLDRSGQDR